VTHGAAGTPSRRHLLLLAGGWLCAGAAGGLLGACSPPQGVTVTPTTATRAPGAPAISPITGPSGAIAPTAGPVVVSGTTRVRAAFVYAGSIKDHGRTNAHDDGRKALEQALGSNVETAYTENVPETAEAQPVFEDYARKGYAVIYGASYGFMDAMLQVASSSPDVKFEHCSGFKVAPNLATYNAAQEEPRYVSGTLAGKLTRTSTLGFVGSFPIPEVLRSLNAFAAGVQSTNPAATLLTLWIGTWLDPVQEKAAAESLLDLNADVLTGATGSPALAQSAAARGKFVVGADYDQSAYAPQAVVQSDRFVWGAHYINSVKSILDGTWQPVQRYYHLKDGLVEATPPADLVPADVAAAATGVATQIRTGALNIWSGPLTDNHGNVKAPSGATLGDFLDPAITPAPGQTRDDAYVQSAQMNWVLNNVVGDLPPS